MSSVAVLLIRSYRRVLSPFAGATTLGNPRCQGGVDYARDQRIFPFRGRS